MYVCTFLSLFIYSDLCQKQNHSNQNTKTLFCLTLSFELSADLSNSYYFCASDSELGPNFSLFCLQFWVQCGSFLKQEGGSDSQYPTPAPPSPTRLVLECNLFVTSHLQVHSAKLWTWAFENLFFSEKKVVSMLTLLCPFELLSKFWS